MERDVPETNHEVSYYLHPSHNEKKLGAMKAPRAVKRITFNPSEARPGETLYVRVPKLLQNDFIVPNSLALIFDIDLSGGHANNFLVQNVSRALVDKLVVKFAAAVLDEAVGYDIYKTFQDLFLPGKSATTWCLRGFRAKICAKSAQIRATKKHQVSTPKTKTN